jgi:hypothetical protein
MDTNLREVSKYLTIDTSGWVVIQNSIHIIYESFKKHFLARRVKE